MISLLIILLTNALIIPASPSHKHFSAPFRSANSPVESSQTETEADHYFKQGLKQEQQGYLEAAIESYSQAIRLNPTDDESYYRRANARFNLIALRILACVNCQEEAKIQVEYQKILKDINQAIILNPSHTNAYIFRGIFRSHFDTKYTGAIEDFTRAISLDSNNAEAYFGRGLTYKFAGNLSQARADWEKAAELLKQQGKLEDYQLIIEQIRDLD
jgi:tetratricopeptide (TPR) repeat protein